MANTLENVLGSAATGLTAQSVRMNTIASNLANAGSVGSTEEGTYHKKFPVFKEITQQLGSELPAGGVQATQILHSQKPLEKHYEPDNPNANKDGFVYNTDVNPIEEMTNMIDSSKAYEANVDVMNTTKTMIAKSIDSLK